MPTQADPLTWNTPESQSTKPAVDTKPDFMAMIRQSMTHRANNPDDPIQAAIYQNNLQPHLKDNPNLFTDVVEGVANAPSDLATGLINLPLDIINTVGNKVGDGGWNLQVAPDALHIAPTARTSPGKLINNLVQWAIPFGAAGKVAKGIKLMSGTGKVATLVNTAAKGVVKGAIAEFVDYHPEEKHLSNPVLEMMADNPDGAKQYLDAMAGDDHTWARLTRAVESAPSMALMEGIGVAGGWAWNRFKYRNLDPKKWSFNDPRLQLGAGVIEEPPNPVGPTVTEPDLMLLPRGSVVEVKRLGTSMEPLQNQLGAGPEVKQLVRGSIQLGEPAPERGWMLVPPDPVGPSATPASLKLLTAGVVNEPKRLGMSMQWVLDKLGAGEVAVEPKLLGPGNTTELKRLGDGIRWIPAQLEAGEVFNPKLLGSGAPAPKLLGAGVEPKLLQHGSWEMGPGSIEKVAPALPPDSTVRVWPISASIRRPGKVPVSILKPPSPQAYAEALSKYGEGISGQTVSLYALVNDVAKGNNVILDGFPIMERDIITAAHNHINPRSVIPVEISKDPLPVLLHTYRGLYGVDIDKMWNEITSHLNPHAQVVAERRAILSGILEQTMPKP